MTTHSELLTIDFPVFTEEMANFAMHHINTVKMAELQEVDISELSDENNEYLKDMHSDISVLENGTYISEDYLIGNIESYQELYDELKEISDNPDFIYLSEAIENHKAIELDNLKHELESKLNEVVDLVENKLKSDGDTSETSQRINILNKLMKVDHAITGIEVGDLI